MRITVQPLALGILLLISVGLGGLSAQEQEKLRSVDEMLSDLHQSQIDHWRNLAGKYQENNQLLRKAVDERIAFIVTQHTQIVQLREEVRGLNDKYQQLQKHNEYLQGLVENIESDTPVEIKSEVKLGEMSIGQIIQSLTPAQLWRLVGTYRLARGLPLGGGQFVYAGSL